MRLASRFCQLVVLVAVLCTEPLHATEPQSADSRTGIEEVLVTGEYPGPGLWRVSNGEHVLLILGTHEPLPNQLVWRSEEVEIAITEAQQILGNYSASFSLRDGSAYGATGKPLRRLLPRKTYDQWLALKKKYIGDNKEVETALPVTAALFLRSSAMQRSGLTNSDQVWRRIYTLARNYQIPVTTDHQVNKVISSAGRDTARTQRVGVDYLINTIANLEADLRTARARANAWAVGDIDALQQQAASDKDAAYLYASSWPFLQDNELKEVLAQADKRWLDSASSALQKNPTTLAALPIFQLLREDGLLTALRARGFTVDAPVY